MRLLHFAHKLTPNVEGFISSHDVNDCIIKECKIDPTSQTFEIIQMSQTTIEVNNGSRMIVTTLLINVNQKT